METITRDPALPGRDQPLAVRLQCCEEDRRARVVRRADDILTISEPFHPCGHRPELGEPVVIFWSLADDAVSATGELRSIDSRRPAQWGVAVTGPARVVNRRADPRFEFGAVAEIWVGTKMIPARIVDRSRSGFGCRTGGAAGLKRDMRVMVRIGDERVQARVVRVRPAGRSLDIGLQIVSDPAPT